MASEKYQIHHPGRQIRIEREKMGVSLRKLHELAKDRFGENVRFNPSSISKWENEETSPRPEAISQLAEIFDCGRVYLMTGLVTASEETYQLAKELMSLDKEAFEIIRQMIDKLKIKPQSEVSDK